MESRAYGIDYASGHHLEIMIHNEKITNNLVEALAGSGPQHLLVASSDCTYRDDGPDAVGEVSAVDGGNLGGLLVKIKRLQQYFPLCRWSYNMAHLLSNAPYLPGSALAIRDRATSERPNKLWNKSVTIEATTLNWYVAASGIRPDLAKIDAESADDVGVEGAVKSRTIVNKLISYDYRPYEWHEKSFREHVPASDYPYSNLLFLSPQLL